MKFNDSRGGVDRLSGWFVPAFAILQEVEIKTNRFVGGYRDGAVTTSTCAGIILHRE